MLHFVAHLQSADIAFHKIGVYRRNRRGWRFARVEQLGGFRGFVFHPFAGVLAANVTTARKIRSATAKWRCRFHRGGTHVEVLRINLLDKPTGFTRNQAAVFEPGGGKGHVAFRLSTRDCHIKQSPLFLQISPRME